MRVLLTVALVAACRPAPPAAPFTLRVAVSGPLDPVTPTQELRNWTSLAISIVFQPLIDIGPGGELLPILAARAEIAGNSLRVWLREGTRFSDGAEVTFPDVAGSLSAARLRATSEDGSILISAEETGIPIELIVARAYIFRRTGQQILGTGTFVVAEQDSSHIVLDRLIPAPGFVGRVRIDSYATPQDAFARTLKGDADMLPDVQSRWIEFFEGVPRLQILRAPGPSANMVVFNRGRVPRPDRDALVAILSSDEVRQAAFGGDCVPPARRPETEPLPHGRPLNVIAVPIFDRFALAVRRALGPRGGSVRTPDLEQLFSLIKAGDYDLAAVRPRTSPPVVAVLAWHTGAPSNVFGYSNSEVDAALDRRDWVAAERALFEDPPGVIVCTPPAIVVLDARIRNAALTSSFKESLPQWEVAQ